MFLPVWLFVVVPYPWFDRWSDNPHVRAFDGPDLAGLVPPGRAVVHRDDVPALSEDFAAGHRTILDRLPGLLEAVSR